MLAAAAIFGGFYHWARRQGLVGAEGGQRQGRISLLTEVVAYIGVILLLSGGVAAVGQQWNHFSAWGHVAAFAGAAAFLFLVGFMLRGVREPAIQRLVSVLWFLSAACVAGAAGYLVHGVILSAAGPDGGATALSVGLAASLYAAALWLARRSAPQDLALFAGLIILICGIVAVAANGHTDAALLADALALWGFGLAWAWLGWRRYIEPMWLTVPLGALLALVAPSVALDSYGWMYATGDRHRRRGHGHQRPAAEHRVPRPGRGRDVRLRHVRGDDLLPRFARCPGGAVDHRCAGHRRGCGHRAPDARDPPG